MKKTFSLIPHFFVALVITLVVVYFTKQYSLLILAVVGFIQNMAFTATSRSRNSANPIRHFYIANGSNGIWFVCNFFLILPDMLKVIESGDLIGKITVMVVYVLWTSLGSSYMMMMMLKTEKGKNKVGASIK
jgi:hypothetical protein